VARRPPIAHARLEQLAQARCEDAVAVIEGVLRLANEMGEADLIVLGSPAELAARRSETQKSGRTVPRNSATTSLPRLGG